MHYIQGDNLTSQLCLYGEVAKNVTGRGGRSQVVRGRISKGKSCYIMKTKKPKESLNQECFLAKLAREITTAFLQRMDITKGPKAERVRLGARAVIQASGGRPSTEPRRPEGCIQGPRETPALRH